jgi:hypothetical protein
VIDKTIASAFAEAVARGEAPKDEKAQLALARSAFIPHLAQVNAAGQFVRRVAAREEIPAEARGLIDRFADRRLLIRDRRQDTEVIEVAHEAALRQPPLSDWLKEDREFLVWRERSLAVFLLMIGGTALAQTGGTETAGNTRRELPPFPSAASSQHMDLRLPGAVVILVPSQGGLAMAAAELRRLATKDAALARDRVPAQFPQRNSRAIEAVRKLAVT